MGVLIHGDAAFSGQGVVYETMGFHNLPNYGTGVPFISLSTTKLVSLPTLASPVPPHTRPILPRPSTPLFSMSMGIASRLLTSCATRSGLPCQIQA
ncbi:hypothetical protein EDD16DRAFT_816411 [Pisolithus croceorrhizus]|nr:hypothetical protein EDD16DRAFT_816411 [Pisolithus croceorrhizus]